MAVPLNTLISERADKLRESEVNTVEPKVPQVSENVSRIHDPLARLTLSITPPMEAQNGV